jgi:hypothetical protein
MACEKMKTERLLQSWSLCNLFTTKAIVTNLNAACVWALSDRVC